MPDFGRLHDRRSKDYKGVPPAQPICDSYRRSCVARRLLWRTETARFLLPDKPCADKEIPLRVGGVPAALLRHLQLSKRSGASRGGGHHRGISAANDMTVYIVIFDRKAYQISGKLFADITEYIDDHYVGANTDSMRERLRRMGAAESRAKASLEDTVSVPMMAPTVSGRLDDLLMHLDEGFSETRLSSSTAAAKRMPRSIRKQMLIGSCSPRFATIRIISRPNQQRLLSPSRWS